MKKDFWWRYGLAALVCAPALLILIAWPFLAGPNPSGRLPSYTDVAQWWAGVFAPLSVLLLAFGYFQNEKMSRLALEQSRIAAWDAVRKELLGSFDEALKETQTPLGPESSPSRWLTKFHGLWNAPAPEQFRTQIAPYRFGGTSVVPGFCRLVDAYEGLLAYADSLELNNLYVKRLMAQDHFLVYSFACGFLSRPLALSIVGDDPRGWLEIGELVRKQVALANEQAE